MQNPNNFEEASAATEELFSGGDEGEDVSVAESNPADNTGGTSGDDNNVTPEVQVAINAENQPSDGASELDNAAQTAEVAASLAAEKDSQLKEAMAQIDALKKQNETLQGTIDEISKQNTDRVIEEALTPPTLDINSLTFADEDTQKAALTKYAEDLSAYNRSQIMKEMSPALEYAKKSMKEEETKEVVSALEQIPELADIRSMKPKLDRIIANNKWLQSDDMPIDEKYIAAYAMAKGIDSINNPPAQPEPAKELSPEELLALYNSNKGFRELVEKQRIDSIKQSQQVPAFSASSGAVNAALDIKEKPQTLEEASRRTIEMFGGM